MKKKIIRLLLIIFALTLSLVCIKQHYIYTGTITGIRTGEIYISPIPSFKFGHWFSVSDSEITDETKRQLPFSDLRLGQKVSFYHLSSTAIVKKSSYDKKYASTYGSVFGSDHKMVYYDNSFYENVPSLKITEEKALETGYHFETTILQSKIYDCAKLHCAAKGIEYGSEVWINSENAAILAIRQPGERMFTIMTKCSETN